MLASDSKAIPFKDFLSLVAFATTITISVSVSASQGFATGGHFFGVSLSASDDLTTAAAIRSTRDSAVSLSWSAALSGISLILTLLLQLLMTSPSVLRLLLKPDGLLKVWFGMGSFVAIGLQAGAMAMIGQALKSINPTSGLMIQWCLLATSLPAMVLWVSALWR